MMRKLRRKWSQWTTDTLDLPKDAIIDLPRVTLIGDMQLYIENHRGVLQFENEKLRLALSKGTLEVSGKNLVIRAILTEEVFIEGEIHEFKYV